MTQFDEAIQKAVIEIVFESPHSPHPEEIAAFVDDVITRHFTEIEAVFSKLTRLAKIQQERMDFMTNQVPTRPDDMICEIEEGDTRIVFPDFDGRTEILLADPQVKAAMERSKE